MILVIQILRAENLFVTRSNKGRNQFVTQHMGINGKTLTFGKPVLLSNYKG